MEAKDNYKEDYLAYKVACIVIRNAQIRLITHSTISMIVSISFRIIGTVQDEDIGQNLIIVKLSITPYDTVSISGAEKPFLG